jgi:hypothetical protein
METSRSVTDLLQQSAWNQSETPFVHPHQPPLIFPREIQPDAIAAKLLDDPRPSYRLIEFLKSTPLSPAVASRLMLVAGLRRLALSDEAWERLLNCMQRSLAEKCLTHIANEGGYPLVIQRLLSILISHYRTPNPHSFVQNLQTIAGLSSVGAAECKQFFPLKNRIETELAIPARATEVQGQFLFYAKMIVIRELTYYPVPCRAMNVWLNTFLDTVSSVHHNDLSQNSLTLPAPERSKTVIHEPLYMTLSSSFMRRGNHQDSLIEGGTDNDGPSELVHPYSAMYDTFRRGLWLPEERYALGLKSTILKIRSDWRSQIELHISQCGQWARAVRLTIEAIDSGAIRQAFANLRSTNQIEFIENLAKKVIGRMVADVFICGKSSKMFLPIPRPRDTQSSQYPSSCQVWLKACPTTKELPLITVATPSGAGTFKIVWKVVRLVGEPLPNHMTQPVYAYAKFRRLETQGQQERLLYTSLATARRQGNLALVQELLPKAEKTRKARASIQAQIEEEVSIAKEVGANVAVLMQIQRKLSNPEAIKGGEMECWDTNLTNYLYRPLHSQDRIHIAHYVCSLIEALHSRKILHLDVKSTNFLCRMNQNQVEIRLVDFGAAKQNCYGQPYKQRVCTFQPPEAVEAKGVQPVIGPPLDAWGLGVTVFEIVCGGHNRSRIINKAGEPQKQEAVLQTIHEYEEKSGQPQVAAVLRGLLDFSPQTRWSAQQAREVLAGLDH